MKKEVKTTQNRPSATTKSGLEDIEKIKKGVVKEAMHPGGGENATGVKNNEKGDYNNIGSKPVKDEDLNFGNK
jgi:hypothetical protein